MGIGDIIGLVSFSFGMIIAYPALLMLLNILFAGTTSKAAYRLHRGMRLPFFVGLIIAIVGGFIVLNLLSAGSVLQFLGVILYLVLAFWGTLGIASMARVCGERLSELDHRDPAPLFRLLSGGAMLTLSFAFPLIGWFILIPLGTVIGLGAATMSLFTRIPKDEIAETMVQAIS